MNVGRFQQSWGMLMGWVRLIAILSLIPFMASCQSTLINEPDGQAWSKLYQEASRARDAGNAAQALPIAQQAYELASKTFGSTDKKTLLSQSLLASAFVDRGRFDEAEPFFEQVLAVQRDTLGESHHDTLNSLNNLAQVYHSQGQYGEAEPLFEQLLVLSQQTLGETHPDTLVSMNNLAVLYRDQGRYGEAEPLNEQALALSRKTLSNTDPTTHLCMYNLAILYRALGRYDEAAPLLVQSVALGREIFGETHPNTLVSMDSLGRLYQHQGRYAEAEPLLEHVLLLHRQTLGKNHPSTLKSMSSLGQLYQHQGRYGEAEPLYEQALELSRQTLGEIHPSTVLSMNDLGALYQNQGRYGEAEPFYEQALNLRHEILGETHSGTLVSMSNLAALYVDQGRYGEAEPLYQKALELRRQTLGETHPYTLLSLNNLAVLYHKEGRYGDAELLYQQALAVRRQTLGETHPNTLSSLNNLAALYHEEGQYGDAEPLYEQASILRRQTLGDAHPETLNSANNLAALYLRQGRYGDAERLLEQSLGLSRDALDEYHPTTLLAQLESTHALVALDRIADAVARLRDHGANRLVYAERELATTRGATVRSQLLRNQSRYQDTVMSLALQHTSPETLALAGDVMLSWKQVQAAEAAFIAHLSRTEEDEHVRDLAQEIAVLRARLAKLVQATDPDHDPIAVLEDLEAKELALTRLSDDFKQRKEARRASVEQLQAVLPENSGVIEFRQFHPVDFTTADRGALHFAALLVRPDRPSILIDAGSVEEAAKRVQALHNHQVPGRADQAAAALHEQLFSGFGNELDGLENVYIAPDGVLHLVPFDRLRLSDGRYWGERQALRSLATGRDLLIPKPRDRTVQGLLAIGGVDFGDRQADADTEASSQRRLASIKPRDVRVMRSHVRSHFGRFEPLSASGIEVAKIGQIYSQQRPEETVAIWTGKSASEANLKALKTLPRVLHVATHGFYLPTSLQSLARPQLYSGLVLSGANEFLSLESEEITSDREDGILYSLEVQDLNLEGTELVVLSACDTGKGVVDYSEGIVGMVRALRIAGAKQVLMTLWPVLDQPTAAFMETFYEQWLISSSEDPAAALDATKEMFRNHDNPAYRSPRIWAPFVLIGV